MLDYFSCDKIPERSMKEEAVLASGLQVHGGETMNGGHVRGGVRSYHIHSQEAEKDEYCCLLSFSSFISVCLGISS